MVSECWISFGNIHFRGELIHLCSYTGIIIHLLRFSFILFTKFFVSPRNLTSFLSFLRIIFHSITLRYLLPTIHGSLLEQALSFGISGIRILVSVFWGSILSLGSPFLAFLHLQFWRLGVYGFWGGLCLPPFGDPFHCYWFPTFQFYANWSFGFSAHF